MISKQLIRNRLRPQLARRQSVTKTRSFGFNSRRLHQSERSSDWFRRRCSSLDLRAMRSVFERNSRRLHHSLARY